MRLQSKSPSAPVQKIRIIAEPMRGRSTQTGLFVPAAPDPQKLELTLARIAAVVGENNVGSPELLDTHRPDGFHIQKFRFHPLLPERPRLLMQCIHLLSMQQGSALWAAASGVGTVARKSSGTGGIPGDARQSPPRFRAVAQLGRMVEREPVAGRWLGSGGSFPFRNTSRAGPVSRCV